MNKFCTYHLLSTNQRSNCCLDLNEYALSLHGSNYSLDYMHHPLSLTPVRFCWLPKPILMYRSPELFTKSHQQIRTTNRTVNLHPWKLITWNLNNQGPLEKEQHLKTINFLGSMLVLRGTSFPKGWLVFGTSIAQCISITPSSVAFGNPDFGPPKI